MAESWSVVRGLSLLKSNLGEKKEKEKKKGKREGVSENEEKVCK